MTTCAYLLFVTELRQTVDGFVFRWDEWDVFAFRAVNVQNDIIHNISYAGFIRNVRWFNQLTDGYQRQKAIPAAPEHENQAIAFQERFLGHGNTRAERDRIMGFLWNLERIDGVEFRYNEQNTPTHDGHQIGFIRTLLEMCTQNHLQKRQKKFLKPAFAITTVQLEELDMWFANDAVQQVVLREIYPFLHLVHTQPDLNELAPINEFDGPARVLPPFEGGTPANPVMRERTFFQVNQQQLNDQQLLDARRQAALDLFTTRMLPLRVPEEVLRREQFTKRSIPGNEGHHCQQVVGQNPGAPDFRIPNAGTYRLQDLKPSGRLVFRHTCPIRTGEGSVWNAGPPLMLPLAPIENVAARAVPFPLDQHSNVITWEIWSPAVALRRNRMKLETRACLRGIPLYGITVHSPEPNFQHQLMGLGNLFEQVTVDLWDGEDLLMIPNEPLPTTREQERDRIRQVEILTNALGQFFGVLTTGSVSQIQYLEA